MKTRSQILIKNTQSDFSISLQLMKKICALLFKKYQIPKAYLYIHFVTGKKISALHQKFFSDPSPTDCISFPIDWPLDPKDSELILGEVFICPKIAVKYASKKKTSILQEVILYLIHGFLHLIGYDDTSSMKKREMRQQERQCLKFLEKNLGNLK